MTKRSLYSNLKRDFLGKESPSIEAKAMRTETAEKMLPVMRFIVNYCERESRPPSVRDIVRMCNLPGGKKFHSTSHVFYLLDRLEQAGYLTRKEGMRNIIPTEAGLAFARESWHG